MSWVHTSLILAADLLLVPLQALLLIPVIVFLIETLLATTWRRAGGFVKTFPSNVAANGSTRPKLAVLVPAHNEEAGLAATLATITPQLRQGDRLLVIADNCNDSTASVARVCGAEAIERNDPDRRGKGYALDFGIMHLKAAAPEMVIVVDADCFVAPHAIDWLAFTTRDSGRPVQALYLMHVACDGNATGKLAEFAFLVKNLVRPLGLSRVGMPCQLTGSGMCFPWSVITGVMLASGNIVEDMQLGIDLTRAGQGAQFCPEARVDAQFPTGAAGTRSQRMRWEHGHLAVIAQHGLRLLYAGLRTRNAAMVTLALDLCVPPMTLLLLWNSALTVLAAVLALVGGSVVPLIIGAMALVILFIALFTAWWRHGREVLHLRDFLALPRYVCRKLPVYARLLGRRQTSWVRSQRDGEI